MRALIGITVIVIAAPASADVLVVAQSGGGDYTAIQAAYDASQPGDTVLVQSGTYRWEVDYEVTIGHGIALVAVPTHDVELRGILVSGLPAGEVVVISGFDEIEWIRVTQCDGDVRIQDTAVIRHSPAVSMNPALFLDGARSVVVEHSSLIGSSGIDDVAYGVSGGAGLHAIGGSQVALYDCELQGGDGGHGLSSFASTACGGDGESAALILGDSELYAMGSQFHGGDYGYGCCGCSDGSPGYGLFVDPTSSAVVTDVSLVSGIGSPGSAVGPIVDLNIDRREVIAPTLVREGVVTTWTILGQPGDAVHAPASLLPQWRYLPAAKGVQTFDLPLIGPLVLLGVIGQQGTLTIQVPSQTLAPGVENLTTYHQVFVLDAHEQRVLGGGHAVVTISDTL